jgi:two-component system, OmpR family, response regulator
MGSSDEQTPPSKPVYQTDIANTPLPEILVTIHRYKAPGTIECRRGNELKEIFLDRGQIIFATSNQIRDSLGDQLLRDGKITQEQYDESVRLLVSTGKRQGTILTEMNVIASEPLFEALREQILAVVWSVFTWDAGSVSFTPGRHKQQEFVKVDIPIPQAILQGVRRVPDPKPLVARLGTKTTVLTRTDKEIEDLTLDDNEHRLLDACNGKNALIDLISIGPLSAANNAKILYAFVALQLVAAKAPERFKMNVRTAGDTYSNK